MTFSVRALRQHDGARDRRGTELDGHGVAVPDVQLHPRPEEREDIGGCLPNVMIECTPP